MDSDRPPLDDIGFNLTQLGDFGTSSDYSVTSLPEGLFEIEMPLADMLLDGNTSNVFGDIIGEDDAVTMTPHDAVTVHYVVEGEEVRLLSA